MDIAYDIARLLATSGFGTLGGNIHVSQTPSDQDGIYVVHAGGSHEMYNPIEEAALDIYVRNMSAQNAITTLSQITKLIHRMYDHNGTSTHVYTILAIGGVETVDRNQEYARLYKQTFSVLFKYEGIVS